MHRRSVLRTLGAFALAIAFRPPALFAAAESRTAPYRKRLGRQLDLCKDVPAQELGAANAARFSNGVMAEFDRFSAALPEFKDKHNAANFTCAPFFLAAHRVLTKEFSYPADREIAFLSKCVELFVKNYHESLNPFLKFAYKRVGKTGLLRSSMAVYFKYSPEPYGWRSEFKKEPGAYLAVDMTECGMYKWLSEQGAPNVCAAACYSDVADMKYMPGLRLERKKTIANGDGVCTFRYFSVE